MWDEVAADGAADPLLRDLANLTWCIYHADKGDPALLEGRLKPLAAAGNAWRPLAQEQLALLDLREGHTEAAKTQLQEARRGYHRAGWCAKSGRHPAQPSGWMSDMIGGKSKAGTPARSRLRSLGLIMHKRMLKLPRLRVLNPARVRVPNAIRVPGFVASTLSRRTALLAPLALAGCDTISGWFETKKDPLPGKREPIGALRRGFNPDEAAPNVALPPPVRDMAWPQAAGGPTHLMGNLSANETLKQAWSADVGEGGGYRRQILAQPVVANGVVFAMDSDSVVTAYQSGHRREALAHRDGERGPGQFQRRRRTVLGLRHAVRGQRHGRTAGAGRGQRCRSVASQHRRSRPLGAHRGRGQDLPDHDRQQIAGAVCR